MTISDNALLAEPRFSASWTERLGALDSSVREVHAVSSRPEPGPSSPAFDPHGILVAAMAAAARAGKLAADSATGEIQERKRRIDSDATTAAESILEHFAERLVIVAGEGPGEQMPGAYVGQQLGGLSGRPWSGVFDYIDGTTLTALGLPGALALGGLGQGLRSVPDLQAYAVLAPTSIADRLDIMTTSPENHALDLIAAIGAECGVDRLADLRVVTHSPDTGPFHQTLIQRLVDGGVGDVVVPAPVIIEPPYVLARAGVAEPRVDTMIGVFGFPELAFACLLLELIAPQFTYVFRPASLSGLKHDSSTLSPLFDFTEEEIGQLAEVGLDPDVQLTGAHLVPPGSGRAAAMFSVTGSPLLRLEPPVRDADTASIEGLLAERDNLTRLRITWDQ